MRRATFAGIASVLLLLVFGMAASQIHKRQAKARAVRSELLKTERKMPPALGRHLEKLAQAVPGLGGESERPGSSQAEKFLAMAYPDTDIPLARLEAARSAASSHKNKAFPTGKGRPGTWVTVGPSQALYPFTQFRSSFSYVPNAYVASGRATAIAIDPNCAQGNCRLWVFAAGGGVWRTKNALNGQPSWKFLSGDFGIQSGSSIALDPNDPTGNTLYAGTGEANASGDSAAGVGMYKSTDGGDSWTGPLGASVFGGRAIGSIAVKAGDPQTIYAATTRAGLGISSVTGGGVTLIPGAAAWGLYKSTDGGATWTFLHNGSANATECDTVLEGNAGGVCSLRGVRRVALDPLDPEIVYAGSYARGVWRSVDEGATWSQIKPSLNAAPEHHASRDRRHRASQRQDAHVRLRRPHQRRRPVQPSLPQRRRGERGARIRRSHLEQRRQPGLRDLQRVHRTVLVRQLRLHAGRSSRRRLRGRLLLLRRERFRTSAVSCSRPTPA